MRTVLFLLALSEPALLLGCRPSATEAADATEPPAPPPAAQSSPQPNGERVSSVFVSEPASDLADRIRVGVAGLARDFVLSAENAGRVRDSVPRISKFSVDNVEHRRFIENLDAAAVPALEQMLVAEDDTLRLKAIEALGWLIRVHGRKPSTYRGGTEGVLLDLFSRSLLDRSTKVRTEAIGDLRLMGIARHREIPDAVKTGLGQAAASDPDPDRRKQARYALEDLGLAPRSPDRTEIAD